MRTSIHSMLALSLGLLLSLTFHVPAFCYATEYYVTPSEGTPCPGEPCYTLQQYAENATQFLDSTFNVTLLFLPGVHMLNQSLAVTCAQDLSFILFSKGSLQENKDTRILCSAVTCFHFTDSSDLVIEGLIFLYHDMQETILQLSNITNFAMDGVVIYGGIQGVVGINVAGSSLITSCVFSSSNMEVSFAYYDSLTSPLNSTAYELIIEDSWFESYNTELGGMISINFEQSDYHNVNLIMTGNRLNRVGINMIAPKTFWNVQIRECHIANSRIAGIYIQFPQRHSSSEIERHVDISGCMLEGNSFGGLFLIFNTIIPGTGEAFPDHNTTINVMNSVFSHNQCHSYDCYKKGYGAAVTIKSVNQVEGQNVVEFQNVSFKYNEYLVPNEFAPASVVHIQNANNSTFDDGCIFIGNSGTPIVALWSTFEVSGNVTFINNTSSRGGAIAFYGESHMTIHDSTHILFQDNTALYGGAVFVHNTYNDDYLYYYRDDPSPCFFQFPLTHSKRSTTEQNEVKIFDFVNNTAYGGGSNIFGAALYACTGFIGSTPSGVLNSISNFEPTSAFSSISSMPSRVCLCNKDGTPNCTIVYPPSQTHYPGEQFLISAVAAGDTLTPANGTVYAQFLLLPGNQTVPMLAELQYSQQVYHGTCTDLRYTVMSNGSFETITLTTINVPVNSFIDSKVVNDAVSNYKNYGIIGRELLTFPVYLNITLLPCPLGFTLVNHSGKCTCNPWLLKENITCNISDQTIHRTGATWINESLEEKGILTTRYCPYDYCKTEEVAVNLSDPDTQCTFNHSGTICGSCLSGLSVAIGSSRCLHCSNKYLALLIPFTVAGFALVFFIKFLNLTVSMGTINGLIFYANIAGATPTLFFPPGRRNILTVFISWLNLDLGIETCFYDGMTAYERTWLQFVFPFYIWAIAGLIILVCRYSTTACRIFGRNSVSVLATLILLSYAKLLRNIISILSFTILYHRNESTRAVWSVDGNIRYLSPVHIPLFLMALGVLLLLWLPYTVALTFGQCLQRVTDYRGLLWVVKLKPFFDAYLGLFKDMHRYWVGALLLLRGLLFIIIAVNPTSTLNPLLVSAACFAILMYSSMVGNVYKTHCLSVLENSFILNLGILSGGTGYVALIQGNQAALAYTSASITFATFAGIVVFHVWRALMYTRFSSQLLTRVQDFQISLPTRRLGYENLDHIHYTREFEREDSVTLREPVIEFADSLNQSD